MCIHSFYWLFRKLCKSICTQNHTAQQAVDMQQREIDRVIVGVEVHRGHGPWFQRAVVARLYVRLEYAVQPGENVQHHFCFALLLVFFTLPVLCYVYVFCENIANEDKKRRVMFDKGCLDNSSRHLRSRLL